MNIELTIGDLVNPIRALAVANQVLQNDKPNLEAKLLDKATAFDFEKAIEGPEFWTAIVEEDYVRMVKLGKSYFKMMTFDINRDAGTVSYYTEHDDFHYDLNGEGPEKILTAFDCMMKHKELMRKYIVAPSHVLEQRRKEQSVEFLKNIIGGDE
jgi:hypothetical protein